MALLHGAELLAYASVYEGFGLPPLEAMACGTPAIASSTSSIPEVVGDAGLIVDPESTDEIAHAMLRMNNESTLRDDLSRRGRERARKFTWEKTATGTADVYARLAGGGNK
jgi:glycosyltransferase involved in cell wall biosynthesis